jgi:RNA polymerase primary sigma factor
MDCADDYSLPIQDFDWLSDSITTRGILVYNEAPSHNVLSEEDEFDDYAQTDYDAIYDRIVELSPSLEAFVSFVKSVKPPQKGEIKQLKYQIVDGNTYARNRMIEMYLRLALRVALQRAEAYDMEIEDAVGYSCIGLVTAVDKYDPDASGAFASYAALWILQNISREQSTQRPLVYYPVHKKEDYFIMYPLLKKRGCIGCDNLRRCEEAARIVREEVGCSEKRATEIIGQMFPDDRIDELLKFCTDDINENTSRDTNIGILFSHLSSESVVSEEDSFIYVQNRILAEDIDRALSTLTQREKRIIQLRYGFEGHEYTLEEAGKEFHLTRERIRQIESNALRKLRHPSVLKHLRGYL